MIYRKTAGGIFNSRLRIGALMGEAVAGDKFYSDGRGPELDRVYWSTDGRDIKAVDYHYANDGVLRHVKFLKVQVVMITPEEVIDFSSLDPAWKKGYWHCEPW